MLTALDIALVKAGHCSVVIACRRSRTRGRLVEVGPWPETLSSERCDRARREHRRRVEQALSNWPVDLIHMHGVDFFEYLPDTDLPVLVTLHLPFSFYPEQVLRDLPHNIHLHCVSESQANLCPPGVRLLETIPNGTNLQALRARHAKRNFALALGRICPEKGFHIAVEAANRAAVPLVLGGEVFGYKTHGEYWRKELLPKLDRKHRWIGPVDFARKRRLLTAARCLLVPSLVAETGSLVAMEALACGTPVIAFPHGVLADMVEHGKTGYLVRNVEEMSQAIQNSHKIDPEACRRAACEHFSHERMTRAYLDLYWEIARGHAMTLEERRVA
jgi:glycosyltransferase involved in cell wall biosynthesis